MRLCSSPGSLRRDDEDALRWMLDVVIVSLPTYERGSLHLLKLRKIAWLRVEEPRPARGRYHKRLRRHLVSQEVELVVSVCDVRSAGALEHC